MSAPAPLAAAPADGAVPPAGRLVWALCIGMLALWGLAAAQWHPMPQTDSLEQILFAQDWRLAYAKHPPLPTWIYKAVAAAVGPSVGLTFVLGAACAATAVALLYLWARPLVGARNAALAALLGSLVVYFNVMTSFYNHNTVQLPFTVACIALFHRAFGSGRWRDWLGFGAIAGLTLLVKLTALLVFAAFAVFIAWWRWQRGPIGTQRWRQMIVAALLALAIAAAPLWALYGSGDAAGRYVGASVTAATSLGRRLYVMTAFSGSVLSALLPAILLFALLRWRRRPAPIPVVQTVPLAPYLAIVGFVPFALALAAALFAGANLLSPWGTSLFTTFALWLAATSRWRVDADAATLRRAAIAALALHALLFSLLQTNDGRLPNLGRRALHVPIPTADISARVTRAWQAHSSAPMPVVAANIRTGAPLALGFAGAPRVIDGNRADFEQRVPADVRRHCGIVYVSGPATGPGAVSVTRVRAPVTDPVDLNAVAVADSTSGRSVPIDVRNRAGGISRYIVTLQLPDPPDGSGCNAAGG